MTFFVCSGGVTQIYTQAYIRVKIGISPWGCSAYVDLKNDQPIEQSKLDGWINCDWKLCILVKKKREGNYTTNRLCLDSPWQVKKMFTGNFFNYEFENYK